MTEGEKIRARRLGWGMTQAELAEQLGCSVATVQRWESGARVPRGGLARGLDRVAADFETRFPAGWAAQVQEARGLTG